MPGSGNHSNFTFNSDSDSDTEIGDLHRSQTGRRSGRGSKADSDTDSFAFLTAEDSDAESSVIAPSTVMPSAPPVPGLHTSFLRSQSLNDPFIYDTPRDEHYTPSEVDTKDMLGEELQLFQRGVYQLFNVANGKAVDLAGVEANMIIGYSAHGNHNQQWELVPLGPGYAIRSAYNGSYMSISAPSQSMDLVASRFPVSWEIQEYTQEEGRAQPHQNEARGALYRLRWPGGVFVLELDDAEEGLKKVRLAEQKHEFAPSQLWNIKLIRSLVAESTRTPRTGSRMAMPEPQPQPQFSKTTRSVNGRGDVVTTTTTTTTTVVTTTSSN